MKILVRIAVTLVLVAFFAAVTVAIVESVRFASDAAIQTIRPTAE